MATKEELNELIIKKVEVNRFLDDVQRDSFIRSELEIDFMNHDCLDTFKEIKEATQNSADEILNQAIFDNNKVIANLLDERGKL